MYLLFLNSDSFYVGSKIFSITRTRIFNNCICNIYYICKKFKIINKFKIGKPKSPNKNTTTIDKRGDKIKKRLIQIQQFSKLAWVLEFNKKRKS
jgi:hypothetical protein